MDDERFEDSRSKIDPQSGANGVGDVVDRVAARADGAVAVDKNGIRRVVYWTVI